MEVSEELLRRVLDKMVSDWEMIDAERGPTNGGLDGSIARGHDEEIRELRELLKQSDCKHENKRLSFCGGSEYERYCSDCSAFLE